MCALRSGYPSIKVFGPDAEFNPYTKKSAKIGKDLGGVRSASDMVTQVLAMVPNYVHNVTSESVEAFLQHEDYPKAVLLSDKAVPPSLLKSLAVQFRGRIRFGMASSEDAALAAKFGATEFPKMVVVPGSDPSKAVPHAGKIKHAEVNAFLAEHAAKVKRPDPLAAKSGGETVDAFDQVKFEEMQKDKKNIYSVYFHKGGSVPADVSTMARAFKSFKHASVDCAKLSEVCKDQVVTKFPSLRVYMLNKDDYEEFTGNPDCLEDCLDIESMSDFVANSLPNVVVPVDQTSFSTYLNGVAERPKVMLFTKKAEPTALYKSVALNYRGVLPFGLFASPPQALLDQVGLGKMKLPALIIFFSHNGTAEAVQGMPYSGGLNYEEMTATFDQFADPFREGGAKQGSTSGSAASPPPKGPIPEMTAEGTDYEKLCGSRGGLCAIAFLDGMDGSKERREEQLKMLEEVRTKIHPSPFHISWVDAVCHSQFAAGFDVTSDKIPTLAVISPSKGRYMQHIGKFAAEELQVTLKGVITGKKQTGPFSSVNPLSARACKEVHDEITAAMSGGGSEEEDEIMREMMEELKAKEKAAEEEEEEEDSPKKKKKKSKKRKGKK